MKLRLSLLLVALLLTTARSNAQYAEGDRWYNNPLGFEPVKLHTAMGFILPAVATGACLLLTERDSATAGRLSVYEGIGLSWGYKYPHTFLPGNTVGVQYRLRKFLSVGAEFDVLFPRDDYNRTTGFAIRPFARFYAVNRDPWRLYFESGGGLIHTLTEFPKPTDRDDRLGLRLNGITKYGIGTDIRIAERTYLMFSIRHVHISNGNSKGVERNPSHDSNGVFVGISKTLR